MKKYSNRLIAAGAIALAILLLIGGWVYVLNVRESLWTLSVTDLKEVASQASHAFEIYLKKDIQNTHGMSAIMSKTRSDDLENIKNCVSAYNDIPDGSFYSVIDVEKGVIYSDLTDEFGKKLSEDSLNQIRKINGSVVEEPYLSDVTGLTVMACQESFTFADGKKGVVRKAFGVSKVVSEFALSLYDGKGFSYIVNKSGDILVRSLHVESSHTYKNIFDAMALDSVNNSENLAVIEDFKTSMRLGNSGVVRFSTESGGEYLYAYIPIGETNGWYYITVVPGSVLMEQSNHILNISQLFIIVTAAGLLIVVMTMILVRKNRTAMQRIEKEVRSREQLFDILTNGTGDAFIMLSLHTQTVDYVSPNIEHLMGVEAESVKNDASLLVDSRRSGREFMREISAMETGTSLLMERQRLNKKTGELQWFAITVYRVMIEDEERSIVVFSDRTAEKRREQALEDATNIAETANRAKSAFLSNMSHDIRTPMNAIVGLCTLIDRDAEHPDLVRAHTKKMLASSRHLLGLINDVLDMSKIEAGKTSLNITELNLAEIVEELVTVMMPQAHAKSQTFDVSAMDIKSEHLLGDKLRINQILINILSNAIKYTQNGGKIELVIREMPRKVKGYAHLRFIIKDNGMGISPDYIDTIFQPFTRETGSAMNKIQGTGLGMAITKSLVDLMGGNISVESELDKGSTFTVDLDLHVQDREAEQHFWEKHGIKRVLVVDDDEEACSYVVSAMIRVGVAVQYALSGPSAIDVVKADTAAGMKFDLILMDLKMPDMDGIEASRQIRGIIGEKTPILAFTSYDWNVIEERAREAGINGFMSKPFFISNLELCVEKLYEEQPQKTADSNGVLEGLHILVAEDIELNSDILAQLLDMRKATCEIEDNGEKAVKRFENSREGEFDIILMDLQMPVMNGYEAARAIRKSSHPQAKTIPIIAMTADAFAEDVRRSIEAGMNAHVAKPIDLSLLEEAVREAIYGEN